MAAPRIGRITGGHEVSPAARHSLWSVLGTFVLAAAVFGSLCTGVIRVAPAEVWQALWGGDDGSLASTLVVDMRLPRAIAAACVGAGLATAGCVLQALLRDPLASPTMIGTAQASSFGRVLGVFLGTSYLGSVALAFASAVAATLLVLAVARSRRSFPSHIVLLAGVNVGMLFAALVGLVQYASKDEGQLSRMVLFMSAACGRSLGNRSATWCRSPRWRSWRRWRSRANSTCSRSARATRSVSASRLIAWAWSRSWWRAC